MSNDNTLLIVLKLFKLFGFVPYSIVANKKITLQKYYIAVVTTFLAVYWMGLIESFWSIDGSSDKLSVISNWIQLIANGLSMTIILVSSMNVKTLNTIRMSITNFDSGIREMGLKINNRRINLIVVANFTCYILFFFYMASYEIYVVLIRYKFYSVYYWIITFIPVVLYTMALSFAFCLLIAIYYRLKLTSNVLKDELMHDRKSSDKLLQNTLSITSMTFPQMELNNMENATKSKLSTKKQNEQIRARSQQYTSSVPSVFHILNDLLDLGHSIEKFFGPIFLCSFTSIFIVTTIQIYYCYVLISTETNESLGYSIWTVIVSTNIIVINIVTTILMTSLCETITNQSRACIRYILKMRISGTIFFSPEEIQKMTAAFQFSKTDIKFSAMGFFKISYSMLCGVSL